MNSAVMFDLTKKGVDHWYQLFYLMSFEAHYPVLARLRFPMLVHSATLIDLARSIIEQINEQQLLKDFYWNEGKPLPARKAIDYFAMVMERLEAAIGHHEARILVLWGNKRLTDNIIRSTLLAISSEIYYPLQNNEHKYHESVYTAIAAATGDKLNTLLDILADLQSDFEDDEELYAEFYERTADEQRILSGNLHDSLALYEDDGFILYDSVSYISILLAYNRNIENIFNIYFSFGYETFLKLCSAMNQIIQSPFNTDYPPKTRKVLEIEQLISILY